MASRLRILSIDGGGIRGYLPALVLAEIERRSGRRAIDLFDLAAGTSTGAIISIGLGAGLSAAELAEFYPKYGSRIFRVSEQSEWSKRLLGTGETWSERLLGPPNRIGAVFGREQQWGGNARHSADGLESVLQEVLGDIRLSDAELPLLVTSYEADANIPVVFSSIDAAVSPETWDAKLTHVARATSAAPTYLPPAEFSWAGERHRFVDGGVWANNPAVVAMTESLKLTSALKLTGDSIFLVSLGTGMPRSTPAFVAEASWLGSFVDVAKMATSVTGGDVLAARALGDAYARLQAVDDRIAGAMDDPSTSRLTALRDAAQSLIRDESAEIDRIVANLVT
ncbi:patatin-like phospholipase family protein [Agromyces sp. NPDC058484]|uniref:patatin-like phospholipase family protein n=1 Tax=Agromyces sp. NPDC058484 TaxID=3346524 RepID=UPI0036536B05